LLPELRSPPHFTKSTAPAAAQAPPAPLNYDGIDVPTNITSEQEMFIGDTLARHPAARGTAANFSTGTDDGSVADTDALTYNFYERQEGRYNIKAKTKIELNTGFVLEDMNSTIEELFLSENVWITESSNVYPIIPQTQELVYKTRLNDKLINFSVEFKYAYNEFNIVR